MSIPNEFTGDYYDVDYFSTPEGKKFQRPDGSTDAWSYSNETGEFLGAKDITIAWNEMFHPKKTLDVGAGRGTFIAYARDLGIKAVGFDYSEWAVSDEGRYARCKKDWLKRADATRYWPYMNKSFDLVVSLDFWEHMYEDDIPFVKDEMFRVANKWIFLQIATTGSGGLQGEEGFKGYVLKRGEPVPVEIQGCAVAGHVTVRDEQYWLDVFEHDDWQIRRDMKEWFCSLVDKNIIRNWLLNSIIVLERVE